MKVQILTKLSFSRFHNTSAPVSVSELEERTIGSGGELYIDTNENGFVVVEFVNLKISDQDIWGVLERLKTLGHIAEILNGVDMVLAAFEDF